MKDTPVTADSEAFRVLAALPPRHRLMMLTMGRVIAQVIWVLTDLRVADHLADGPKPVTELARLTGADPLALRRILRCATAYGVFVERPGGEYELTPMSDFLRAGAPQSLRDLVLMNGTEMFWRPYEAIAHTARTGRPSFEEVFGESLFGYLDHHPDSAEIFHRAMTATNRRGVGVIGGLLDLSSFSRVADVGGGQGYLLAELLVRHPQCKGVLFDRPSAVDGALPLLRERGVADRVELIAGDFFTEFPAGCDAYVLKFVLHDWPDDDAARILANARRALGNDGARLFVIEHIVEPPNTLDVVKFLDMDMMVFAGGRERTLEEFQELAGAAGLAFVADRSAAGLTVLEFRAR
ncbi:methyltransferase [Actinoallomurus sp. NPDC052274]|uniref:methyltransferase n=1 Tax=Actinoallomurus sp. NPDC052274 TaxID=3155420 RepID=UPI00342371BB